MPRRKCKDHGTQIPRHSPELLTAPMHYSSHSDPLTMNDTDKDKGGRKLAQSIISSVMDRSSHDLPWSPTKEKVLASKLLAIIADISDPDRSLSLLAFETRQGHPRADDRKLQRVAAAPLARTTSHHSSRGNAPYKFSPVFHRPPTSPC